MRFILTYVSFLAILFVGLCALALDGSISGLAILIGSITLVSVVALVIGCIFLVSSPHRIQSFVTWLPQLINRLTRFLHYKAPKELINMAKVKLALDEIHQSYKRISENWGILRQPMVYALLINVFDILAVYLVYLALGAPINPGIVILAYAVANMAGVISVLPSGVIIYEALMIGILVLLGVDEEIAIAATLVPRILKFVVFVPLGYFFHYSAINKEAVSLNWRASRRPGSAGKGKPKSQTQAKTKTKK